MSPAPGVSLSQGDIVAAHAEAIVNAANSRLLAGGGVDGAIHRAAGPELQQYLLSHFPEGCPTGNAVTSPGFRLPARLLVHAVGPFWRGGRAGEAQLLASAYRSAFRLAAEAGCASVAAPAISTGAFGFPIELGAEIAVGEALRASESFPALSSVELVLLDDDALSVFRERRRRARPER